MNSQFHNVYISNVNIMLLTLYLVRLLNTTIITIYWLNQPITLYNVTCKQDYISSDSILMWIMLLKFCKLNIYWTDYNIFLLYQEFCKQCNKHWHKIEYIQSISLFTSEESL